MTCASGLEPNDQTKTLKTACRCAQFCMLRMSTCVASFMLLSTMVSPMLKVCLSLYTLLRSHLRSHLFVNCCIRRYSLCMSSVVFAFFICSRSAVVVSTVQICFTSVVGSRLLLVPDSKIQPAMSSPVVRSACLERLCWPCFHGFCTCLCGFFRVSPRCSPGFGVPNVFDCSFS